MALENEDVKTLHTDYYSDNISSIALSTLNQAKFNKKDYIPLTEDLIKFKDWLEN